MAGFNVYSLWFISLWAAREEKISIAKDRWLKKKLAIKLETNQAGMDRRNKEKSSFHSSFLLTPAYSTPLHSIPLQKRKYRVDSSFQCEMKCKSINRLILKSLDGPRMDFLGRKLSPSKGSKVSLLNGTKRSWELNRVESRLAST